MTTDASSRELAGPPELAGYQQRAREHLTGLPEPGSGAGAVRATLAALRAAGFLDLILGPRADGGAAAAEGAAAGGGAAVPAVTARTVCEVREAVARVAPAASTALVPQASAVLLLADGRPPAAGDPVPEWARAIREGSCVPGCAISEREAGSDPGAITCQARPAPGGWRLSGTKAWIANAPHADLYLVMARSADLPGRGLGFFAIPADAAGLRAWETPTSWPYPLGEIELDEVLVPAGQLLGEPGAALSTAKRLFALFRPSVGAHALGCAGQALAQAVDHAHGRVTFGRLLAEYQAVSHRLAELHTRLTAARLLVYRAAEVHDAGGADAAMWSAMAKLCATETAQQVVDGAIQVFGASGLEGRTGLDRLLWETRASRIYEGASEIQREIIWQGLSRPR